LIKEYDTAQVVETLSKGMSKKKKKKENIMDDVFLQETVKDKLLQKLSFERHHTRPPYPRARNYPRCGNRSTALFSQSLD